MRVRETFHRVHRASDHTELSWRPEGEWTVVDVPELDLYDILVFGP